MASQFTITQKERLIELNGDKSIFDREFESDQERNQFFYEIEKQLVKAGREQLGQLLQCEHQVLSLKIQQQIENWLMGQEGFTKVTTPIMISRTMLDKMTVTRENPLSEQVFWMNGNKCLRPMLAPNLYVLMRDMHKVTKGPVKIFEVGSCFRKESQGAQHMNEFTMLNFVEFASVEDGGQMQRLEELAHNAMKALEIADYHLEKEGSAVYGETLDITVNGVEIASGSYGPHPLDEAWAVFDTWVGFGFGIERIAMVKSGSNTIKHVGKSTSFVHGTTLKL